MKRVVSKITQTRSGSWQFTVTVDGEEFAKGTTREYLDAVHQAHGYSASLFAEASYVPCPHLNCDPHQKAWKCLDCGATLTVETVRGIVESRQATRTPSTNGCTS